MLLIMVFSSHLRCLVDRTVGVVGGSYLREFKFKFQSFVFAELGDRVFVHCTVVVCETGESTNTCTNVGDQVALLVGLVVLF